MSPDEMRRAAVLLTVRVSSEEACTLARLLREEADAQGWRDIATAPRDGTPIMVYCPRAGVVAPAKWDDNRFAKKPRPYWTHWGERIWGTLWIRDDQPTHWRPLPPPPQGREG